MQVRLEKSKIKSNSSVSITGSKSESNRLLLLKALYPEIEIENLSNSDDSRLMELALDNTMDVIDIHHAGTAMRFLTAYFATQYGREVIITGSERMKERPIKVLVDALAELGAEISYLEKNGCPPLQITGKEITNSTVSLKANVSSQYITALLLVAPKLKNGLLLELIGKITSLPYINMTLGLLNQIGVKTSFEENQIEVIPLTEFKGEHVITVESDWSSASYFYSIVALSSIGTEIRLSAFKEHSLQGDSILKDIYKDFGVQSHFEGNMLVLKKVSDPNSNELTYDLKNAPDIAQTIAVSCLGLGLACYLTGLHTLKIKETDRLSALKKEIKKCGGEVRISKDSLRLKQCKSLLSNPLIETYNDHRMAMAFAPLALRISIQINNAEVVSKSYPDFWDDLEAISMKMERA